MYSPSSRKRSEESKCTRHKRPLVPLLTARRRHLDARSKLETRRWRFFRQQELGRYYYTVPTGKKQINKGSQRDGQKPDDTSTLIRDRKALVWRIFHLGTASVVGCQLASIRLLNPFEQDDSVNEISAGHGGRAFHSSKELDAQPMDEALNFEVDFDYYNDDWQKILQTSSHHVITTLAHFGSASRNCQRVTKLHQCTAVP
jgi:hypothetical protein